MGYYHGNGETFHTSGNTFISKHRLMTAVVVVGAGVVGLSIAIMLAAQGY